MISQKSIVELIPGCVGIWNSWIHGESVWCVVSGQHELIWYCRCWCHSSHTQPPSSSSPIWMLVDIGILGRLVHWKNSTSSGRVDSICTPLDRDFPFSPWRHRIIVAISISISHSHSGCFHNGSGSAALRILLQHKSMASLRVLTSFCLLATTCTRIFPLYSMAKSKTGFPLRNIHCCGEWISQATNFGKGAGKRLSLSRCMTRSNLPSCHSKWSEIFFETGKKTNENHGFPWFPVKKTE